MSDTPNGGAVTGAPVTAEVVSKVAELARIRLETDETAAIAARMEDILGYVDRLKSVDVSGVDVMAHPADAVGVPRPDAVVDGLSREQALSAAPATDGVTFVVPPVLDA